MTWSAKTCQTPSDTEINISADKIRRIFVCGTWKTPTGKGLVKRPLFSCICPRGKQSCAQVSETFNRLRGNQSTLCHRGWTWRICKDFIRNVRKQKTISMIHLLLVTSSAYGVTKYLKCLEPWLAAVEQPKQLVSYIVCSHRRVKSQCLRNLSRPCLQYNTEPPRPLPLSALSGLLDPISFYLTVPVGLKLLLSGLSTPLLSVILFLGSFFFFFPLFHGGGVT